MNLSEQTLIHSNRDGIAAGFMKCLHGLKDIILIAALSLIVDGLSLIQPSFESHLSAFIDLLLDKVENVRSVSLNASSVLRCISSHISPYLVQN
jgi:hypothetical protein